MRLNIDLKDALARTHTAYIGFDKTLGGWPMPRPANPHTHLRDPDTQPDLFELAVPETAKLYAWCTAMPNLGKNRIRTPQQAIAYRERIRAAAAPHNPRFDAEVPLFLEPDTDLRVLRTGFEQGAWRTAKVYPRNGTTESDFGVDFRSFERIYARLAIMEELGMRCLVHAEVVLDEDGELVVDRFREELAVAIIGKALKQFPKLRVVVEHVTSRAMIAALKRWRREGYRIEATIAPQYLLWNSSVLFERGMNPGRFSVPVLKDEEDRSDLVEFMLEGGGMLGTDSAPHVVSAKSRHECCPGGVFNEPVGLFVYFHLFRMLGSERWFEQFTDFACRKASEAYGREPVPGDSVLITETPWDVPERYQFRSAEVVPMFAGMKAFPYSLKPLPC
jgi:dihydroorotase